MRETVDKIDAISVLNLTTTLLQAVNEAWRHTLAQDIHQAYSSMTVVRDNLPRLQKYWEAAKTWSEDEVLDLRARGEEITTTNLMQHYRILSNTVLALLGSSQEDTVVGQAAGWMALLTITICALPSLVVQKTSDPTIVLAKMADGFAESIGPACEALTLSNYLQRGQLVYDELDGIEGFNN